jgi:histidinol dehydrogenase
MQLIKYPRRQDWEKLFKAYAGNQSIDLAIYADETASPSEIAEAILVATQNGRQVFFITSHNLFVDALLDEIDKRLIGSTQKPPAIGVLNRSVCFLVKDEKVSVDMLKMIRPEKINLYSSNSDRLSAALQDSGVVINADNIDNIE